MSNAWAIYLEVEYSSPKGGVILDSSDHLPVHNDCVSMIVGTDEWSDKALALREGPASYQLVGEVIAHQG